MQRSVLDSFRQPKKPVLITGEYSQEHNSSPGVKWILLSGMSDVEGENGISLHTWHALCG